MNLQIVPVALVESLPPSSSTKVTPVWSNSIPSVVFFSGLIRKLIFSAVLLHVNADLIIADARM